MGTLSSVRCAFSPPGSQPVSAPASQVCAPCVCSGELASSQDPPSGCRPSRISGSLWLENGGLFAVWWGVPSLGPSLPLSPPPCLLPPVGDGPFRRRLALLWNFSVPLFFELLAVCLGWLIFSLSLAIPQFKLLSHVSSLQLPSGHSGLVLTLSNAARSSVFRPYLLVADAGVWRTFLLGVAFRHVICGFYLFFLPVRLHSKIRKLSPDPPVRRFPGVWKLPLLQLPSQDGSPSLALLSLFLSFIFCPTSFRR